MQHRWSQWSARKNPRRLKHKNNNPLERSHHPPKSNQLKDTCLTTARSNRLLRWKRWTANSRYQGRKLDCQCKWYRSSSHPVQTTQSTRHLTSLTSLRNQPIWTSRRSSRCTTTTPRPCQTSQVARIQTKKTPQCVATPNTSRKVRQILLTSWQKRCLKTAKVVRQPLLQTRDPQFLSNSNSLGLCAKKCHQTSRQTKMLSENRMTTV